MTNTFWLSISVFVDIMFEDSETLQTLFEKACKDQHIALMDLLLLQFDFIDPTFNENYAIRYASGCGHFAVLDRLLQEENVDPSAQDNFAIRNASYCKHHDVVFRLLQDNKLVLNGFTENNRQNAFYYACKLGNVSIVDELLQEDVDPSYFSNFAIRLASQGHVSVVDRLLQDKRVQPADCSNEAIQNAIMSNYVAVVDILLHDITNRGSPPYTTMNINRAFQIACSRGHIAVVDRLLQEPTNRVDPSANNNEPIQNAIMYGHDSIAEKLLQDPRVDLSDAIRYARQTGNVVVMEKLVQYKNKQNKQNKQNKNKQSNCSAVYNWCKNLFQKT